jgi:hypothetical protein
VDIFDTYETNKVDGLILEFYDAWGFSGSIEISNKKAYTGTFTKIIPLDSLQSISTKKVYGNTYDLNFRHNANIRPDGDTFKVNDSIVTFLDGTRGWELGSEQNDCGTLFSNRLYGVRTYLRRTVDDKIEFLPKKEFFLYTLPFFNDFYYKIDDFSTLSNPKLDLMLTYKLIDASTQNTASKSKEEDGETVQVITGGFYTGSSDSDDVSKYLSGTYGNPSLDIIKYYQYAGTSKLYLEIGLKKEYESYNLSYDPAINDLFSCKL